LGEGLFADELEGFLFLLLEVLFVFLYLGFKGCDFIVFFLYFLVSDSHFSFEVQEILLSGIDVFLEHLHNGLVLLFDVFEGKCVVEV
jgi:hypothetical protein